MTSPTAALPALAALYALVALVPPARADVIVVDAGGGGDFTQLSAAVTAAADGDILLVKPGDYTNDGIFQGELLLVFDISLTIIADGGPVITGTVRLDGLPFGETVVVRGFTVETGGVDPNGAIVDDCDGQIWFEDCSFYGMPGVDGLAVGDGFAAAQIGMGAGQVVFSRCTFQGGRGRDTAVPFAPDAGAGGAAVSVTDTRVALYECTLLGGEGGDYTLAATGPGGAGGPGLSIDQGVVFVSSGSLTGGPGGDGVGAGETSQGGHGAVLVGAQASLRRLDASFAGGPGGTDGRGQQGGGGAMLVPGGGTVVDHGGAAHLMAFDGPAREGGPIAFDYAGEEGDLLFLFVSAGTLAVDLLGEEGVWLVDFNWLIVPALATAGPGGTAHLDFTAPTFANPALPGVTLFTQLFLQEAGGAVRISGPSSVVIVDGGF